MLDLHRMKVLRSVVSTGSISAAAHALGYTPSSVSQQIALLQREIGMPLIERAGRGIRLTAAAHLLAEHADQVLVQIVAAEQALEDHRHGRATRLRVEYFHTAGEALVVPAITALTHQDPGIHIDLRLQPDGSPEKRIQDGDIDLALTVADSETDDDGVVWTHVLEDPFDAVVPVGHPLSGKPVIELSDLAELFWVSHEWPLGPCSRHVKDACSVDGFSPNYKVECDGILTAQGLIAAGLGVGVMPRLGLSRLNQDVVAIPLKAPAPRRRIQMLTPSYASHPIEQFSSLILKIANELGESTPLSEDDRSSGKERDEAFLHVSPCEGNRLPA